MPIEPPDFPAAVPPFQSPTPAAALAAGDAIRLSHQRSLALGLRAHESADVQPLRATALRDALARNASLCTHARPVMETLYSQIVDTQSMVLLTDAQGTILHALGDDDFLAKADRVALCPGVAWSEQSKGTNAIGTALATGMAMQVHADEHFLRANHFLTCSCSPILDPAGQVIGALDVSGDHRSQSKHTMALVRMSAQMVENHLFGKVYEDAVRLRFHARHEFLGTLVEGLAAFTPDGRFLSANRSGQFQFGLPLRALQAHTFSSLFGMDMGSLLAHCRRAGAAALTLHLPGGVKVAAQADFRPRGAVLPPAVSGADDDVPPAMFDDAALRMPLPLPMTAPPRPLARTGLSRLRYLDTGDAQLAQVIAKLQRVSGRDVSILILGETGTGKELLARAIHDDSPRALGPFVAINCAAIPESLIESELFGYDEGAFTGARRKGSPGKIVQAHGGTLFLDEIGDMPLAMQARLLRVLQERSVTPLGGTRQVAVDVAVVCATHRQLRGMMAAGTFRDDLYYRLNGLTVRLPALRERSDFDVIVRRLLKAQDGAASLAIAPEVLALLRSFRWPGNLRQLAAVLRSAALMAEGDTDLRREHLPDDFLEDCAAEAAPSPSPSTAAATLTSTVGAAAQTTDSTASASPPPRLSDAHASTIDHALAAHAGNISAAARALGVSRNTVYRRLKARAPQI